MLSYINIALDKFFLLHVQLVVTLPKRLYLPGNLFGHWSLYKNIEYVHFCYGLMCIYIFIYMCTSSVHLARQQIDRYLHSKASPSAVSINLHIVKNRFPLTASWKHIYIFYVHVYVFK